MQKRIFSSKDELGKYGAEAGAKAIRAAIRSKGEARIIVATGASQFEMLGHLVEAKGIEWHKVTVFHLDEYVGMGVDHPASFRLYLWRRFVSRLPFPLKAFHPVNGDGDPEAECRRLSKLISRSPVDVCFAGIGENGHLAFNDPPADFRTSRPYIVVDLDEACRRQQFGEGWFKRMENVPSRAISMSIKQIMKSGMIVCSVPDKRKAEAVRDCLKGAVSPINPASILRKHPRCILLLDKESASML
ncbi:MAG: glucosamine-6-phosphate deaminase [Victivallales bacterium]|nr:glucosamine-6-phosphate deaminase [Victivallales bacterium]